MLRPSHALAGVAILLALTAFLVLRSPTAAPAPYPNTSGELPTAEQEASDKSPHLPGAGASTKRAQEPPTPEAKGQEASIPAPEASTPLEARVWFHIVDRESGQPIAAAQALYHVTHLNKQGAREPRLLASSDQNGHLHLEPRVAGKSPSTSGNAVDSWAILEIRAPGYTPAYAAVKLAGKDQASAFPVALIRSATLHVRVHWPNGPPAPGIWIELTAYQADLRVGEEVNLRLDLPSDRALTAEAFQFASNTTRSFDEGGRLVWRGITDASGNAFFDSFPTAVPWRARLGDEIGQLPILAEQSPLLPGSANRKEWVLPGRGSLRGVLVGDPGLLQSCSSVGVCSPWALECAGAQNQALILPDKVPWFATTKVGSDGTFEFKDLPEGDWFVGPIRSKPQTPAELQPAFLARAQRVRFEAHAQQEPCSIPLERGARVNGTIRDPNGTPVQGARVLLTGSVYCQAPTTESGPSGWFEFDNVASGNFELFAIGSGKDSYGHVTMNVKAGDQNLAVVLE